MNPSDLETAVSRGHAFLLRTQHGEGWWADFWLSPGKSDGWVTAYAGGVVAAAGDAGSRSAACAAWQWLARRPSPGWGYNGLTPDDADSTAWAIRLAEVVGAGHTERVARARALLATHVHPDGGVSTYGDDGAIRSFIGAPAGLRFDGWCRPQPCVTAAAAAGGLGDGAALRYLRAAQKDDGHWLSYWWCEDEYATAMAATALGRHGRDRDDNLRVAQAAAWAAGRLGSNGYAVSSVCPTGSPFATALALRTLGHGGKGGDNAARARRAVDWLFEQQRPDGSWVSSAGLRVPYPGDTAPERHVGWKLGGTIEGAISLDQERIFTTATVVETLRTLLERPQPPLPAAAWDGPAWDRLPPDPFDTSPGAAGHPGGFA